MNQPVLLKGNSLGLTMVLDPGMKFDQLIKAIEDKFVQAKDFFNGQTQIALKIEGRKLDAKELQNVLQIIAEKTTLTIAYVIEDDKIIAKLLKKNLRSWGYDVSCAEDFSNIIQEFARRDPQLVLLDLKLPFYNGFHWCEEIRRISQVPIIFISSASDNMNMVMAMSRGADDFIAKPFDLDVLTAKIQAILRRTYSFGTPGNVLEHKGAVLNPSRCILTWNGHDIDLTKNELRILEILLEHAGKAVSRDSIMTKLWESDSFVDDNTLTVNITRLRKKLEGEGLKDFIITKKGLGYMV
jgi:two-component system response regulator protein BraR/BceR